MRSSHPLVASYEVLLTLDNHGEWCAHWPAASELDLSHEDQRRIGREWVAEVAPDVVSPCIGWTGGSAGDPFTIHAYSNGAAGERERFDDQIRPSLIKRYRTGENDERKGCNGWHWIEWVNEHVTKDPTLLADERADDLYALYQKAGDTTSVTIPLGGSPPDDPFLAAIAETVRADIEGAQSVKALTPKTPPRH